MSNIDKIQVEGIKYGFDAEHATSADSASNAGSATSAGTASKLIATALANPVMQCGDDVITYQQVKTAVEGGGPGPSPTPGGNSDTALRVAATAAGWIDPTGVKHTVAPTKDQTADLVHGIWGGSGITETYKDKSVSNLTVFASKNLNVEAKKNIQMKSEAGTMMFDMGKVLLGAEKLAISPVDQVKYFATSDANATRDASEFSIEYAFDDLGDITLDTDSSTDTAIGYKFSNAKWVKDKAPKNSELAWGYANFKARAYDFCCVTHGGIALQPAGADSSNHLNKVKFEHSLAVPVEHFSEYTVVPGTTYNYAEGAWVCIGQLTSEDIANNATQVIAGDQEFKVMNKNYAKWNDGVMKLGSADTDKCGIAVGGTAVIPEGAATYETSYWEGGVQYQIGYADTADATEISPASYREVATEFGAEMAGKYLFVKRLALTGISTATLPEVKCTRGTVSGTLNKWTLGSGDITFAAAADNIGSVAGEPALQRVGLDGSLETFPVASGKVTIDGVVYDYTDSKLYKSYKTDTNTLTVGAKGTVVRTALKEWSIVGGKVSITVQYPVHFAYQGGKGIEWGTFNPFYTSIYSKEYRFKADAQIYAATRQWDPAAHSGAGDYKTQDDDTKDVKGKHCTVEDMITVISELAKSSKKSGAGSLDKLGKFLEDYNTYKSLKDAATALTALAARKDDILASLG